MMKLTLAVFCLMLALHLNEAVGQYPRGDSSAKAPVRINPYVMKYLQGYYKKHKTLPPALKRWAYQQLQNRRPSDPPAYNMAAPVAPVQPAYSAPALAPAVILPYAAPAAAPAPAPVQYVPPPIQSVAPAVQSPYVQGMVYNQAPAAAAPVNPPQTVPVQPKSGYGGYQQPTQQKPTSFADKCSGKVHPGWCAGKYAGHYTMSGSSSCYIQCDQWGRSYAKPCAPGTYWRYGGPEPTLYNHCI